MTRSGTVFLIYHELELSGQPRRQNEPGYVRYVVPEVDFRLQLGSLRAGGFHGMSVGEALEHLDGTQPGVAITFDDGWASDLLAAAPALKDAGFNATFYIVSGFVGGSGHLTPAQLRELSDAGFDIGSHSMTHTHLNDLPPKRLWTELVESKKRLEDLIGRCVDHFSCPNGRWSCLVARTAQEAGYRSVSTSRIGRNLLTTDPFHLARVGVMRGISLSDFDRICRGNGLLLRQLRSSPLSLAKHLLGNSRYEKVRSAILTAAGDRGDPN